MLYDVTVRDSTSPSEPTIREWISKLNDSLKTRLRYTQRLAMVLVNRANFVRQKVRKMGGRARHNFFSQNWTLSLVEDDLDPSADEQIRSLQEQLQASTRVLRNIQQNTPARRTAKHYSQRHERRLKKRRVDECTAALSWLEEEGLTPVKVIVVGKDSGEARDITLRTDLERALNLNGEHINSEEVDMISMMLYVKDKYHVSGNAYHEMASLCHQMPRHYKIKQKISELNSKWNFRPTPEGTIGVQQPLMERLGCCLERLVCNMCVCFN